MKGRLLYNVLFILLLTVPISAQLFTGDLVLSTQDDIDDFQYSEVKGTLTIQESEPGAINNLKGLKNLATIRVTRVTGMGMIEGGDLRIYSNSALESLEGLENLTIVPGNLSIYDNASLTDISALSKVRTQWLSIVNNPAMENIDGLSSITNLSSINIMDNAKLKNINGLSNLERLVTSDYWWAFSYIRNNPSLTNIDGLSKVTSIEYYFEISGNPVLKNIDGLKHLTTAMEVYIFQNDALLDINGLSGLKSVLMLSIYENKLLKDLNGLSHLSNVSAVDVHSNPELKEFCGLYTALNSDTALAADTARFKIYSNGTNPSGQEILANGPCLEGKFVRLINFRDGGTIREGSNVLLNWETNAAFVKLEYRYDSSDTWNIIAASIFSSDTGYVWTVPQVINDQKIYIKISYADFPEITDQSTTWILLQNVSLTFLNPLGDEIITAGQKFTISWESVNAYKFKMEYSINGGGSWKLLADYITSNTAEWITPDIISDHVKIRLIEQDLTGIFVDSKEFTITRECSYKSIRLSGSKAEGVYIKRSSISDSDIHEYFYTERLTLTAWVKLDSLHREMPVITRAGDWGSYFNLNISGSNLRFVYSTGLSGGSDLRTEITAPVNIKTNKWYHIAAVRNATINNEFLIIYLNGIPLDTASTYYYGFTSNFFDQPVIIGNRRDEFGTTDNSFSGAIAEVQIYNSDLTKTEINELMFKHPSLNSGSLVGYWPLNGNGNDIANHHFNGAVQGNSAWTCDHPFLPGNVDTSSAWNIQITGSVKNLQDDNNFAGVSFESADGYDYISDIPEPPAEPGNFIRVYFPHPEWNNKLARDYSSDIRFNDRFKNTPKEWLFEVQSNVKDTVILTFTPNSLPTFAKKYFSDLSKPERNVPLPVEYKYYNTSSEPKKFLLVISDKELEDYTVPLIELIQPNGGEIWKSNRDKKIYWKLPENNKPDSIFIYAIRNDQPISIGKTAGTRTEFIWHTPDEYWNNGFRIKVEAADTANNRGYDLSDGTFTIAGDSIAKKVKAGFSLISIPLEITDSSKTSVFEDDIPANSYFLYSFSPEKGYTLPQYVNFGKGYWIAVSDAVTFDVTGIVFESDSTIIDLEQGYNLIGNRYIRELKKDRDLSFLFGGITYNFNDAVLNGIITSKLFGTAGRTYYAADLLNPFEAYWLGVIKPGVRLVEHLPLVKKKTYEVIDSTISVDKWEVPIAVSSGENVDKNNVFGVRMGATPDYDIYDSPEPPAEPDNQFLNLWFVLSGNKHEDFFGDRFSHDFKSPENIYYEMKVENNKQEELVIQWDNSKIKKLNGLQLTLLHEDQKINMLEYNEYHFQYTVSTDFVITGSLTTNAEKNNIPEHYFITENFPNPFNPSTKLDYGLPYQTLVSIKIYDITGKEVAKLVEEEKAPGKYTVEWRPDNLASGLYFCRINAGKYSAVRKLVFLK